MKYKFIFFRWLNLEMLKYGILFLFCIIPYYTGIIPVLYRIEPCSTLNYRKFNIGYNPIVNYEI